MYRVVYISAVTGEFTESMIDDILKVSREQNKIHNITGMLLLNNYQFIQYIEGDEKDIKQLVNNLKKDTRHTDFIILQEGNIDKRLFADWNMLFKNIRYLNEKELKSIEHIDLTNIEQLPDIFQCYLKVSN